jgi:hypothetical protein
VLKTLLHDLSRDLKEDLNITLFVTIDQDGEKTPEISQLKLLVGGGSKTENYLIRQALSFLTTTTTTESANKLESLSLHSDSLFIYDQLRNNTTVLKSISHLPTNTQVGRCGPFTALSEAKLR